MYSNRGGIFIPPTDQGMNFDEQDPNYFQDQDPNYFQPDQTDEGIYFPPEDPNSQSQEQQFEGEPELVEMGVWNDNNDGSAMGSGSITSIHFDSFSELLWTGFESGRLTSKQIWNNNSPERYNSFPERYTSFPQHDSSVRAILSSPSNIISVSHNRLKVSTRGGVLKYTGVSESLRNVNGVCFASSNYYETVVVGAESNILIFDIHAARILRQSTVTSGVIGERVGELGLAIGHSNGTISFRDPRNLHAQSTLLAHTGGIFDFDMKENFVASCGWSVSKRGGSIFGDRFIKLYDARMNSSSFSTINLPEPPSFLRFQNSSDGQLKLICVSSSGSFYCVNVEQGIVNNSYVLEGLECELSAFDVSSTGQFLCFGDVSGSQYLWSDATTSSNSVVNQNSEPIAPIPPPVQTLPITMDENTPLSLISISNLSQPLLSDWDLELTFPTARAPKSIDTSSLPDFRQVDFVGYARNPGLKRNVTAQEEDTLDDYKLRKVPFRKQPSSIPIQLKNSTELESPARKLDSIFESKHNRPPKHFRHIEIEHSGKLGVDGFDFQYFNSTKFGGLENTLPYSYCNSSLQVLNSIGPLHNLLTKHLCSSPLCISCELGFLFHMLEKSEGVNCQASNFLRCFRQIPQASALGLLNSVDDSISLIRSIESFNRFIFEQISKDQDNLINSNSSSATTPIQINPKLSKQERQKQEKEREKEREREREREKAKEKERELAAAASQTENSEGKEESNESNQNQDSNSKETNSNQDSNPKDPIKEIFGTSGTSFSKCVTCKSQSLRPFLSFQHDLDVVEKKNEETGISSTLNESFISMLKSSLERESNSKAWCDKCNRYQLTNQKRRVEKIGKVISVNLAASRNLDLWKSRFQEYEKLNMTSDDNEESLKSWIPFKIWISLKDQKMTIEDKKPSSTEEEQSSPQSPSTTVQYRLKAIISHVSDTSPKATKHSHVVAQILTPDQNWTLFNDFHVVPSSPKEVIDFSFKTPSLLIYESIDEIQKEIQLRNQKFNELANLNNNPNATNIIEKPKLLIGKESFLEDEGVKLDRGEPIDKLKLREFEIPDGNGEMVAIDSEFVSLGAEEAEIGSDGSRQILNPSHFSLARVSVIGASGARDGKLLVDDYILTTEPVIDFLTKYSGIEPSDLDPKRSTKHLTRLKNVYVKVRYLIDSGCKFVGHGLAKDFRIINVLVPKDQILDTSLLFYWEGQRKLSLKFLAAALLATEVQQQTHDSIEDAKTALALYNLYLQFSRQNVVATAIQKIYELGRQTNWQPPSKEQHLALISLLQPKNNS